MYSSHSQEASVAGDGAGRYHRTLLAIVWTVALTLERAMEGSAQRRNIM